MIIHKWLSGPRLQDVLFQNIAILSLKTFLSFIRIGTAQLTLKPSSTAWDGFIWWFYSPEVGDERAGRVLFDGFIYPKTVTRGRWEGWGGFIWCFYLPEVGDWRELGVDWSPVEPSVVQVWHGLLRILLILKLKTTKTRKIRKYYSLNHYCLMLISGCGYHFNRQVWSTTSNKL